MIFALYLLFFSLPVTAVWGLKQKNPTPILSCNEKQKKVLKAAQERLFKLQGRLEVKKDKLFHEWFGENADFKQVENILNDAIQNIHSSTFVCCNEDVGAHHCGMIFIKKNHL
jgi:hypothetical protein